MPETAEEKISKIKQFLDESFKETKKMQEEERTNPWNDYSSARIKFYCQILDNIEGVINRE